MFPLVHPAEIEPRKQGLRVTPVSCEETSCSGFWDETQLSACLLLCPPTKKTANVKPQSPSFWDKIIVTRHNGQRVIISNRCHALETHNSSVSASGFVTLFAPFYRPIFVFRPCIWILIIQLLLHTIVVLVCPWPHVSWHQPGVSTPVTKPQCPGFYFLYFIQLYFILPYLYISTLVFAACTSIKQGQIRSQLVF